MAITFVGAGTVTHGNYNVAASPPLPAGTQAGDLLLCCSYLRSNGTLSSTWASHVTNDGSSTYIQISYKIATGGDASPTLTPASALSGQHHTSSVLAFRGVDPVAPFGTPGTAAQYASAANIGPIAAATASAADGAVVVVGCRNDANLEDPTISVLSGDGLTWFEAVEGSSVDNASHLVVDYAIWAGAAPTLTAKTFTVSASTASVSAGVMLLLNPLSAAAVSYVGMGLRVTEGNAGTMVPTLPAGVTNGDLLFAVGYLMNAGTLSISGGGGGWTEHSLTDTVQNGSRFYLRTWYRFADGTQSDPSITVSSGSTSPQTVCQSFVVAYRGINASTPFATDGADSFNASAINIGPIAAPSTAPQSGAAIVIAHRNGPEFEGAGNLTGDGLTWVEDFDTNAFTLNGQGFGSAMYHAVWNLSAPTLTAKTVVPTVTTSGVGFGKMFILSGVDFAGVTEHAIIASADTAVAITQTATLSADCVVAPSGGIWAGTPAVGDHDDLLTPGLPPGVVNGDLLIAVAYLRNAGTLDIAAATSTLATGNPSEDLWDDLILQYCDLHGHPSPRIIKCQMKWESDQVFDVFCTSDDTPCGIFPGWSSLESRSFGLMQVTPACGETADGRFLLPNGHPNMTTDDEDPLWAGSVYNPELNIDASVKSITQGYEYFRSLYPACPQDTLVLMAAAGWVGNWEDIVGCGQWTSQLQIDYIENVQRIYGEWWGTGQPSVGDWTEHLLVDTVQNGSSFYLRTWYTVYDGSQTAPTITISGGSASPQTLTLAVVLAARGVNTASPFASEGAESFNAVAANVGPIAPPSSITSSGAAIVLGIRNATPWTSVPVLTGDGLSWIEILEITNTVAGLGIAGVADYATWAGSPPTLTAKTFTPTGGASGPGMGKMLVLNYATTQTFTVTLDADASVVAVSTQTVTTSADAVVVTPTTIVVGADAYVETAVQTVTLTVNADAYVQAATQTITLFADVYVAPPVAFRTISIFADAVVNPPLVQPDAAVSATAELSAERTDTAWLVLLTLDHEGLGGNPIRVTNDAVPTISNGITYSPFPFDVILPDDVEGRPPQAQLRIDNTTQEIIAALRGLVTPPSLTIQIVRSVNPDIVEYEWADLEWSSSQYDKNVVTGTLSMADLTQEEFPFVTMDSRFRGLWS